VKKSVLAPILSAILAIATLLVAILLYGTFRWQRATEALNERLQASRIRQPAAAYTAADIAGLPAPVQRYFRAVLEDGQPLIRSVYVEHSGTFNMSETGEQWKPFTSTQHVVVERPGFVWDGRIALLPGVHVHVHDAYVAGEGLLSARVFGLFPVADVRGTAEVAEGELMRFLAEAAWYPTALLPSQGVEWQAVDDSTATATLTDGALSLTLQFSFDSAGLIESVRADARGRTVQGRVIPTAWEGRWSHYETRNGMLIPTEGEVAWLLPAGRKPYWRGRITSVTHDLAQ
jgi:hypothetical protein